MYSSHVSDKCTCDTARSVTVDTNGVQLVLKAYSSVLFLHVLLGNFVLLLHDTIVLDTMVKYILRKRLKAAFCISQTGAS